MTRSPSFEMGPRPAKPSFTSWSASCREGEIKKKHQQFSTFDMMQFRGSGEHGGDGGGKKKQKNKKRNMVVPQQRRENG